MPEQIHGDNWPQGWIPSSSAQADFGSTSSGLLRMDNLTLDEKGTLRLANRSTRDKNTGEAYPINSIFGAYIGSKKLRYIYTSDGTIKRNYGAAASRAVYDLNLGTASSLPTNNKAGFLNALGHVIAVAGNLKVKDDGTTQSTLGVPAPAHALSITTGAYAPIDMSNLNAGVYTNWTKVEGGAAFNNAGATLTADTDTGTNRFIVKTVYATVKDTTDFGSGTGLEADTDNFTFKIQVDNTVSLLGLSIEFLLNDNAGSLPNADSFFRNISYGITPNPQGPPIPVFSLTPGVAATITLPRSAFLRTGDNPTLGWANVKTLQFTLIASATITASNLSLFQWSSGVTIQQQSYVAILLSNTGAFLEYGLASAPVTINASAVGIKWQYNYVLTTEYPTATDFRVYRNNDTLGQYIEVYRETVAAGSKPNGGAATQDTISDLDALAAAAIDSSKILQYYRTALPSTIIGAINFAGRVIYLTTSSFLPSFQLDFGSYDSRFEYELTGTKSERCLFIAKLSVGTFIVATTVDFYQVTGNFALISVQNADGTTTVTQDINILPLGVADPAISSAYAELGGELYYMSSLGFRSLSSGTSIPLNTSLDLLFRNEPRYGINPVYMQPDDLSPIAIAVSGNRIYIAVPFDSGDRNRVLVSTSNPPSPADLRGTNYWRYMTIDARCMFREQDGTVIYGDPDGLVSYLETAFIGTFPVYFLTQYLFGQKPTQTKSLGSLLMYINTGSTDLTLVIRGLRENGDVLTYSQTINTNGLSILSVDPHATLPDCVAFQLEIQGTTATFEFNYFVIITVEDYPPLTFYAILPFSNLGKDTLKKLAKWGVVIDTLGHVATLRVTADNVVVGNQVVGSTEPQGIQTQFWLQETDLAALDWQFEVIAGNGMHFYKFMPPDVLQVYPPGRLLDQVGPLDLDREGIVFMFRLRAYTEGEAIHYKVYSEDELVYEGDITTVKGVDATYEQTLPKGINTSVLRLILTADAKFYRHSLEFKVRLTGKETEQKWVKL